MDNNSYDRDSSGGCLGLVALICIVAIIAFTNWLIRQITGE